MTILVTGVAGFIGFHAAKKLLDQGKQVIGVDNLNDYYDVNLKHARLSILKEYDSFSFEKANIADRDHMASIFDAYNFDYVLHLAAQAGVRYSLENPAAYIDSNLVGFGNILEGCRRKKIKHLVFASSSSVYGANTKYPFQETDNVDHPVSLYAATKKSNELMAHSYASLYGLSCTGLRFFTVYGPWGRPDMAYYKFVEKILNDQSIDVYNDGEMRRDFTYIDDVVNGMLKVLDKPAESEDSWSGGSPDPSASYAPYHIYNIGKGSPVNLMDFIHEIEHCLNKKAQLNMLPMQPGDVKETWADCDALTGFLKIEMNTDVKNGISQFVAWYKQYQGLN